MNYLIFLFFMMILPSCGFVKSDDQAKEDRNGRDQFSIQNDRTRDDDGDGVSNFEELEKGRSPYIANIPDLRVRFLQNYTITVGYKSLQDGTEGEFVIETKSHQDHPDYKYRVGDVLVRSISEKNSASIGKFVTHSYGEVKESDLTLVGHPDVDSKVFAQYALDYRKFFNPEDYELKDIKIELENSVKLSSSEYFSEISNLSLNFYYFDHEKETYELLDTKKIERHFQAGINETFTVTLENIPSKLLVDSFFKRGEFVVSEIGDYEIPEMSTTYKTLLSSVKEKTVPVVYNSPLESSVNYVALIDGKDKFIYILEYLYGDKLVVENNNLKKINQFENNLPNFTYLTELKDLDKKGKWFVFTNKLRSHYLSHKFSKKDIISLSYITGDVLSTQKSENLFSFNDKAESLGASVLYLLGKITPNSRLNFQLKPQEIWGDKIKNWSDQIYSVGGGCGKNCMRREFKCNFEFNIFEKIQAGQEFKFKENFSDHLEYVYLVINQEEFNLSKLLAEKKQIVSGLVRIFMSKLKKYQKYLQFQMLMKIKFH